MLKNNEYKYMLKKKYNKYKHGVYAKKVSPMYKESKEQI